MTRFVRQVDVAIPGGVVAIVGPNGEGKSTLLEAAFGAAYREFPGMAGTIYDAMSTSEAGVGATFVDPDNPNRRLDVDLALRVAGKTRSTRAGYSIDGQARVIPDRLDEFDAIVDRALGSSEVARATAFCAQGRAGAFLTASKTDRRALFAELLGLGELDRLRAQAAALLERVRDEADVARREAAVLRGELGDAPGRAREEAAVALGDVETWGLALAGARESLATAEARADEARRLADEAIDRARRLADARERRSAARTALDLALAGWQAQVKRAEERLVGLQVTIQALVEARGERPEPPEWHEVRGLTSRAAELQAVIRRIDELAAAAAADQKVLDDLAREIEGERVRRTDRLDALRARVDGAVAGSCETANVWTPEGDSATGVYLAAICPLRERDRRDAAELSAMESFELDAQEEASDRLAAARLVVENSRLALARGDGANRGLHVAELVNVETKLQQAGQRAALATDRLNAWEQAAGKIDKAVADEAEAQTALAALRNAPTDPGLADDFRRADEDCVAAAEAEAGQTVGRVDELRARATLTDAERHEAVDRVAAARAALTDAGARHDRAKAAADREDRIAAKIDERLEVVGRLNGDAEEWSALARAFGPEGIQALEIDAAGPAVSALTNSLLESCYGPRYSVRLDTVRTLRDGRQAEDFDVHVYEQGQERPASRLSGGQRVIVGEALGLAISLFNVAQSGRVGWRTLVRDETAGALDPENAQAYVAMLRRAIAAGWVSSAVFVTHSPAVAEAADHILEVSGGDVRQVS